MGVTAGLGIAGVPLTHLAIIFSALSGGERSIRVGDFIALPSGEQGTVEI